MREPGFLFALFVAVFGMGGLGAFLIWNGLRPREPRYLSDDGITEIYNKARQFQNVQQVVMGIMLVAIVVCAMIALLINPPR